MKKPSNRNASPLAVRAVRHCNACGHKVAESGFFSTESNLCTACWLKDEQRFDDRQRQAILKELAEREAIARGFGNHRAVAYPPAMDYYLTRVLESLRRYSIKVRMVLGSEHHDEEDQIVEGHLRRYGPPDGPDELTFEFDMDRLGFFRNVTDEDCTHVLMQEDFERIVRVDLLDELLLQNRGPVTLWTAPSGQVQQLAAKRAASLIEDRSRAKWFVVHIVAVLIILVALWMPAIFAFASGEKLKTFGWLVSFCIFEFIIGMSLSLWEPVPNLSLLSSRRSQRGSRS